MRRVAFALLLACGIASSAHADEERPMIHDLISQGWTVAAMDTGILVLQKPQKIAFCRVPIRPLASDPLAGDDLFAGECRTSE